MAAFLKKGCCNLTYSAISQIFKVRSLQRTTQYLSLQNYATDEPKNVRDILLELDENEVKIKYTEEEIDKMRNVSRLNPHLHGILHQKIPDMTMKSFDNLHLKRKMYAKYGEASGINPKLLWPTKSEIEERMKDDAMLERPLEEAVRKAFKKQAKDAYKRLKKEQEIDENMSKMLKLISDYKSKIRKHRAIRRQTKRRHFELKCEAREVYGYNLAPSDSKVKSVVKQHRSQKLKAYREFKAENKARKNVKKMKIKEEKRAKRLEVSAEKETEKTEVSDTP